MTPKIPSSPQIILLKMLVVVLRAVVRVVNEIVVEVL